MHLENTIRLYSDRALDYQPFLKRKRNFGHLAHWIVIITPSLSLSPRVSLSDKSGEINHARNSLSPFLPLPFFDRSGGCLPRELEERPSTRSDQSQGSNRARIPNLEKTLRGIGSRQ